MTQLTGLASRLRAAAKDERLSCGALYESAADEIELLQRTVGVCANDIRSLRAEVERLRMAEAEAMAVVYSLEGTVERLRAAAQNFILCSDHGCIEYDGRCHNGCEAIVALRAACPVPSPGMVPTVESSGPCVHQWELGKCKVCGAYWAGTVTKSGT